jgi:hypothetical protein
LKDKKRTGKRTQKREDAGKKEVCNWWWRIGLEEDQKSFSFNLLCFG